MNKTVIEERIHAAIRPQLDRADELLDHYTEGLPREVWLPIAYQFKPQTPEEKFAEVAHVWIPKVNSALQRLGAAVTDAFTAFIESFNRPLSRDDLTDSA